MKNKTNLVNIPSSPFPRVVVIGGGFAGINLVKSLEGSGYQVLLLDKNNYHQFQPLLYQVATCGIEPDGIIYPLRKIFLGQRDFCFRMVEVDRIDRVAQEIHTDRGVISYDILVIATGSTSNFFGNDEIENKGVGMKDLPEALEIRSKILGNLEKAAAASDELEREALTNFVIVGAGPSGVETAGALAEFKMHILEADYPTIAPELMKIYLIQSGDQVLKGMKDASAGYALDELEKMGVEVMLGQRVQNYDGLTVKTKSEETITSRCLIWTAGVRGDFPLGMSEEHVLRGNRLAVDRYSQVLGEENVYSIGDVACMKEENWSEGHPMVAPVAIQQAKHLAANLIRKRRGKEMKEFAYRDKGSLATIGRRRAVADLPSGRNLKGWMAWFIWCVVHVASLVGFRNRVLVFSSWVVNFLTFDRGCRYMLRREEQ